MPRNQFQRMVFAFLTVLATVHGYVFYSLYVVNGSALMQINDADSVLHAYCEMGIWKTFCKGHCCPKLARIFGTSAE